MGSRRDDSGPLAPPLPETSVVRHLRLVRTIAVALAALAALVIVAAIRGDITLEHKEPLFPFLGLGISGLLLYGVRRDRRTARTTSVGYVESVSATIPPRRWVHARFVEGQALPAHLVLYRSGSGVDGHPFGAVPVSHRTARRHRHGSAWAAYGDLEPGGSVILANGDQILWSRRITPVPSDAVLI